MFGPAERRPHLVACALATVGALFALTLLAGGSASASCGGTYSYKAKKNANFGKPPLIIGDSTLLLAAPKLAHRGFIANAHGCRQWDEGLAELHHYKHRYGKVAVMALSSNGSVTDDQVKAALKTAGRKRILGLVTAYQAGHITEDAKLFRHEAHKHKRILLIDWLHHSRHHPAWFASDGIHVTYEGAAAQARYYSKRVFSRLKPPRHKRRARHGRR